MDQFIPTETLIIELLLVVSLVAIAVRRLRVPYTVALVVIGLVLTTQQPIRLSLTPELILALFVPPLVFEAAFHLNLSELQRDLTRILLLAVPGVVVTMICVGLLLSMGTTLSLPAVFVFGALISATDPVAVVAMFRVLRVPRQLAVLVEGESLLNDGTAIVLFNLALGVALTGRFDLTQGVIDFVRISAGGVLVGVVLGVLVAGLIARIDDYLIETTLTTVLAFGAYLVAERLQVSGVLAVVAAGLMVGNIGPQGMSPTTRISLFNFWEYVAFLVNSLVFLLIGVQVNIQGMLASWQPVLWAILAVLLARIVVVYGFGWMANRVVEPAPLRWHHVLSWSGFRGAISLALALSLPVTLGSEQELLKVMTYGVVLFTLLVQGMTMGPLLRRLHIVTRSDVQVDYEIRHARLTALRAAEAHLEQLYRDRSIDMHTLERLKPALREQVDEEASAFRDALRNNPELQTEEMDNARRELLRAQRSALLDLRSDGAISEETYDQLVAEVDAALMSTQPPEAEDMAKETDKKASVDEKPAAEDTPASTG